MPSKKIFRHQQTVCFMSSESRQGSSEWGKDQYYCNNRVPQSGSKVRVNLLQYYPPKPANTGTDTYRESGLQACIDGCASGGFRHSIVKFW